MNINEDGATFDVVCKRCGKIFRVIINWGGGVRNADYPFSNTAMCPCCGSRQLELY